VQLANNLIAVLSQTLCPRIDTEGVVAAYEFMYVTPGIQNLIRENKSYRIDSEIQTGKKYGMELLDDNLWRHYSNGKISAEECIDKSKNPSLMVDRFHRNGVMVDKKEDWEDDGPALMAGLQALQASGVAVALPAVALRAVLAARRPKPNARPKWRRTEPACRPRRQPRNNGCISWLSAEDNKTIESAT